MHMEQQVCFMCRSTRKTKNISQTSIFLPSRMKHTALNKKMVDLVGNGNFHVVLIKNGEIFSTKIQTYNEGNHKKFLPT